jgi:hypothetical protein
MADFLDLVVWRRRSVDGAILELYKELKAGGVPRRDSPHHGVRPADLRLALRCSLPRRWHGAGVTPTDDAIPRTIERCQTVNLTSAVSAAADRSLRRLHDRFAIKIGEDVRSAAGLPRGYTKRLPLRSVERFSHG